jgi:hypothetical protein
MLLNPWRRVQQLERELNNERLGRSGLQTRIHAHIASYLVLQREVVNANYALRCKNKQLKQLKALVELHKEYVKLHPPETTR